MFTEMYNLFYKDGKKVVPVNIIDLISPVSLAFFTVLKQLRLFIIVMIVSLILLGNLNPSDYIVWFNTCFVRNFSSGCSNNRLDNLTMSSIAAKSYLNADTQKESIMKDNRRKCGIYK